MRLHPEGAVATSDAPTQFEVDELVNAGPQHVEPEWTKRICARCKERRERYEHAAAGNGTIDEIREAIAALELVKTQGIRLGAKIKVDGRWLCPRCTGLVVNDEDGKEIEVPVIERLPNRAARRARKLRRTK